MNITKIEINLSQEDRERIDKLIAALGNVCLVQPVTVKDLPFEPIQAEQLSLESVIEQAPEAPAKAAPEASAPVKKYELSDIRALVMKLIQAGKKQEARGIVLEYAESVPAIEEKDYAAVYARLTEELSKEGK